jgi:hypothetical protein
MVVRAAERFGVRQCSAPFLTLERHCLGSQSIGIHKVQNPFGHGSDLS